MTYEIVRSLSESEWRQFVTDHPQGNIFHTPEMFQVFARTPRHTPELWAARRDGRVLALLLPVRIHLMEGPLGVLRALTTRAVVYGSALGLPDAEGRAALTALLTAYRRAQHIPLFTELRNLSDMQAWQPLFDEQQFAFREHLDYWVDLTGSPEAVMGRIGSRTRKHLRQGLKRQDVVVEQAREREQVMQCYALIQKSYAQAHVPLVDAAVFQAAFDILAPQGMAQFWLARVGETYAAASVELPYKDVIYGWYGGIDREYARYMPGELLMWHVLEWGAERGYRYYDFGGAGTPDEEYGVRDFKAKFGGTLVAPGRNLCVHAPLRLWLSERAYQVWRHRGGK